jgi:hypothetical protein
VQDPMASIAPDAMMSEMQEHSLMGGGPSGMANMDAMHGTLNLAPPRALGPPAALPGPAPGSDTAASQVSIDRAANSSQLNKEGGSAEVGQGAMTRNDPSMLARAMNDQATQERITQLGKELQIEKESSQAAIMALKKDLDTARESSRTALSQVLTPVSFSPLHSSNHEHECLNLIRPSMSNCRRARCCLQYACCLGCYHCCTL